MERVNSPEGKWAISLCTCTAGMIHFSYGNATLHIAIEDISDLRPALKKMEEALNSGNGCNGDKNRSIH